MPSLRPTIKLAFSFQLKLRDSAPRDSVMALMRLLLARWWHAIAGSRRHPLTSWFLPPSIALDVVVLHHRAYGTVEMQEREMQERLA